MNYNWGEIENSSNGAVCVWPVWSGQTKQELSIPTYIVSLSVYLFLLTTYLRTPCIFLHQLTLSPIRSISGLMTVKAKGSDHLDRLPTTHLDATYCPVVSSLLCMAYDPWTWPSSVSICPLANDDQREWTELHDEEVVTLMRDVSGKLKSICAWNLLGQYSPHLTPTTS